MHKLLKCLNTIEDLTCVFVFQVLFAINKILSKMDAMVVGQNMHNDRVIMHICPLTKKYPFVDLSR